MFMLERKNKGPDNDILSAISYNIARSIYCQGFKTSPINFLMHGTRS